MSDAHFELMLVVCEGHVVFLYSERDIHASFEEYIHLVAWDFKANIDWNAVVDDQL